MFTDEGVSRVKPRKKTLNGPLWSRHSADWMQVQSFGRNSSMIDGRGR